MTMFISESLEGFHLWMEKTARYGKNKKPYEPATVSLYIYLLQRLEIHLDDCPVDQITGKMLEEYFCFLQGDSGNSRHDEKPGGVSGSTLQKHWLAIRLYFDWATREFRLRTRPDKDIELPTANPKGITPFTKDDIDSLLQAIKRQTLVQPANRKAFYVHRPTEERDLAIITLMLDTGFLPATLCDLKVRDFCPAQKVILHGMSRSGLPISQDTIWTIKKYLDRRKNAGNKQFQLDQDAPLFLGKGGAPLTPNALRCLLRDLGSAADVDDVSPYRFRHTFAVQYLVNNNDPINLRNILGLKSDEPIRRYQEIAKSIKAMQGYTSPVDSLLSGG